MNILFVCTGNVSRSFLAEMLLKNEIRQNRIKGINVASAGSHAFEDLPADPNMIDFLTERNIPFEPHLSRPITTELIDWADLILVMGRGQKESIESLQPEAKDKIELLGKYISIDQADDDVHDPFRKSSYHYRLAQSQISLAVGNLIEKLISELG
jgi:protein-tyrosine-phosphatase